MHITYFIRRFIEIVFLGRFKRAMAKDLLYNGWVNPFFIKVACQPASEAMNRDLRQTDSGANVFHNFVDRSLAQFIVGLFVWAEEEMA